MATNQKRKAVSKTRKRTITIEDEVLSLAGSPMTKTIKPKNKTTQKLKAKKPTAKKTITKKTKASAKVSVKKPAAKKKTAVVKKTTAKKVIKKPTTKKSNKVVATRKPKSIRAAIADEAHFIESEVKHIAKNPTVHKVVRFSELYLLSVLVTIIVLMTIAWAQTLLAIV